MVDINLMGPYPRHRMLPPTDGGGQDGGHLVSVLGRGIVALPWHAAAAPASTACAALSRCCASIWRASHRGSVVVPGAVETPLVQTVQIAGVDRDHPA